MQVEWEEYWWEASDWAGMKELGAEKSGCSADGAAWRETWREAISFDPFTGEPTVDRTAHKWAHDAKVSACFFVTLLHSIMTACYACSTGTSLEETYKVLCDRSPAGAYCHPHNLPVCCQTAVNVV